MKRDTPLARLRARLVDLVQMVALALTTGVGGIALKGWLDWRRYRVQDAITTLQNQVDLWQARSDRLEGRVDALEAEIQALEAKLLAAQTTVAKLEIDLERAKWSLEQATTLNVAQAARIQELESERAREKSRADTLERQLEKVREAHQHRKQAP